MLAAVTADQGADGVPDLLIRAASNWPGPFFAARSWAGCTTNMFGFDLRQAQPFSF